MNNKKIDIKTVIPCISVHPFIMKYGVQTCNTCVGVSREFVFFDFPTIPQDIYVLVLTEAFKGSYELSMNIVNENFTQVIKGDVAKANITSNNTCFNIVFYFKNISFRNEGLYFFKILVDSSIAYSYEFPVFKVERSEYTSEDIKNILDDPETVKKSSITLECECGHTKVFSLALDPKDQIDHERIPDNKLYECKCGKLLELNEIYSNLRFYLGTKNIIDTINRNLMESKILARSGFYNSALVIQISAFEAFMRDSFISRYKNWFMHLIDIEDTNSNTIKAKKEIAKVIKEFGLTDQFYERLIFFGKKQYTDNVDEILDYNENLKILLFGEDEERPRVMNRINFQQLKGSSGGFWAYNKFFGINIQNELGKAKKGYYEHLQKSFEIRHKIIHASSELSNKMVVTPEMLQKNEEIIMSLRNFLNEELLRIKRESK